MGVSGLLVAGPTVAPMWTYFIEGLGLSAAVAIVLLILSLRRSKQANPSCLSESSRQNVVRIDALKGDR